MKMKKRDLYLVKTNARLEKYSAKLFGMHRKADEVHDDMKLEYLNQVEKLEGKRDDLKEKCDQLKKTTGGSWNEVKKGTKSVWKDLKESVTKVTADFK